MKRVRLVKVVCQPFYVVDDGEHLTDQPAEPLTIPAAAWDSFPAVLAERAKEFERTLNEPEAADASD